jgi:branched-chain amino acid transport system substrate-binding protein
MFTRRTVLKTAAAAAATGLAAPALARGAKIRLGYISPQSGPLSAFSESDAFNIAQFMASRAGSEFEVVVKDSQSNPNRAAEVAQQLIVDDGVNLMLVGSTPETTNPVTTTCELEGIPCLSTLAPWQPWFIGQQSNPTAPDSWKPFNFSFHYFWGLEDIISVFTAMWSQLDSNKKVGGLFPNDADGNAWGDPQIGLRPGFDATGYSLLDPGRFQNLTDDFSAQINAFKADGSEIVTGVIIPPDFTTFWNQAKQQNFAPKAVTVAKALLFPQSVATLGDAGHNLSSEVWWTPTHPYTSSLNGSSAARLAEAFTAETSRPWTQPIGFVHSLFEVAADVMGRVSDVTDGEQVAAAISETELDTVVGRIAWTGKGVPPFAAANVTKTLLTGGQWRRLEDGSFDLVIVENSTAPDVPVASRMQPLG